MAQFLLVLSYIVLIKFGADVFAGGAPDSLPVRAGHQAVT